MPRESHLHGHACDCAAHSAPAPHASPWSALLPVLACALCPACLATYTKVLSVFGVGFGLSEVQHLVLLIVAIGASVSASAWRSWRTARAWPLGLAVLGSALVLSGHLSGDLHAVEWAGMLVLVAGGLIEHFRLARRRIVSRMALTRPGRSQACQGCFA